MDADRWQKINHAFFAVFTLDADRRSALLADLCAHDPSLIDEVTSLVAAHQQAGEFIQRPALETGQLLDNIATRLMEGRKFGSYRVLRKIGHGGMGAVYLAARDDGQYQKLAAVKMIKAGLDTAFNVRQFCKERQILANLDHPNIARLLDGGATEDGVPYLVMEYIQGQPVDIYCDRNRLSILERLQLFVKVCSAVEHAHQEGVIHRDLKPGNILVTPGGEPKLLDFGIAKLLAQEPANSSGLPTTSLPRMTPEYASPEEVQGQPVTRATDIYSLGVVLYELLSGHRPYRLKSQTPEELSRAIHQAPPEKLSARILSGTDAERIADLRGDRPERIRRFLAGDLDNIVLMAIRKEPERRYLSVEQFSQDIRSHLAGLPVSAHKDTLIYRSTKFVRRNRLAAIAAVLVLVGVLVGTIVLRRQAHLAQMERDAIQEQSTEARREILGTAERARMAEMEASHLRQQSEWEKQQAQEQLLQRLNQILEARHTPRGLVINTSNVIFNAGRITLTSDARERLAKVAGVLLEYPDLKLQVEGYTDSYGDDAYNQALSEERARVVQAYLVSQGIPRAIISARGFGGVRPIASNGNDAGRQRNRRVEIVVSGGLIGNRSSPFSAASFRNALLHSPLAASQSQDDAASTGVDLALHKPATGSTPCIAHEGPEKAFNGSVSGGNLDKWCSEAVPAFLQVDLGAKFSLATFIVHHASAGGEDAEFNTRDFEIQVSANGADFITVVKVVGNTQGVTTHTISPTIARFVRLNITAPAQQPGIKLSRIYEFEIYSAKAGNRQQAIGNRQ